MADASEEQIVMFADGMILVDSVEVVTTLSSNIGQHERQPLVALSFEGRVNHAQKRDTVHVALSPRDALQLVQLISDSVLAAYRTDSFGRPTT